MVKPPILILKVPSVSQEAFDPINPSLNPSKTHEQTLAVNQIIPSTSINSFEGIVLNKTKSSYPDLAFSLGQSMGNNIYFSWVNTSSSQNLPPFNPSQPLIHPALESSLHPVESEVLAENSISLNKGKTTEDLEKLAQVSTEVSPEINQTEANNSAIILNKAETEKVNNFSFPIRTEEAIALNSNLPESDLFQPSLHKDPEKIASFSPTIPLTIAQATPATSPPDSEVPIQPETPATIPLPSAPAASETEVLVGEITVTGNPRPRIN